MPTTRVIAAALAVAAGCASSGGPTSPDAPAQRSAEVGQARLMLEVLRAAAAGPLTEVQMEAVMSSRGTQLVIEQQNLARQVTPAQYRALLAGLSRPELPALTPSGDGERARRGLDGLRNDVWPALRWGTANADLLARRVADLEKLDVGVAAHDLALSMLPSDAPVAARLYVVMGGRAGAAALVGGHIYVDVLALSYREHAVGAPYPSARQLVELYAHEIHHLGMRPVLARRLSGLNMTPFEQRAFETVAAMVMEGSATYLINARGDLASLRKDPAYAAFLADPDALVARCEDLVSAILNRGLAGEEYEKAIGPLFGSGFHGAGALMLDAIWRDGGRKAVMNVVSDPRLLFSAHNAAAARLSGGRPLPRIDATLAAKLSLIGTNGRSRRF
jgi:hypothetical protein